MNDCALHTEKREIRKCQACRAEYMKNYYQTNLKNDLEYQERQKKRYMINYHKSPHIKPRMKARKLKVIKTLGDPYIKYLLKSQCGKKIKISEETIRFKRDLVKLGRVLKSFKWKSEKEFVNGKKEIIKKAKLFIKENS